MGEKRQIERATAEAFLGRYNPLHGSDFRILAMGDSPDAQCADSHGRVLNLEITMTEDRPGDIQAARGRSNSRSLYAARANLERVRRGVEGPQFSSLSDDVVPRVAERINDKLKNDYGPNVALVIRDTSGVDWDWGAAEIQSVKNRLDLNLVANRFSCGIWLLSRAKTRLFRIA